MLCFAQGWRDRWSKHAWSDYEWSRSTSEWSNCVLCIPFILSGSPNEFWLHTYDACTITTRRLGLQAPPVARNKYDIIWCHIFSCVCLFKLIPFNYRQGFKVLYKNNECAHKRFYQSLKLIQVWASQIIQTRNTNVPPKLFKRRIMLYTGYIDMQRIIQLVTQALDSDESKNSIIQRNNQAKDKNANKQEATSWIAYNLKEWSRNWNKDKQ